MLDDMVITHIVHSFLSSFPVYSPLKMLQGKVTERVDRKIGTYHPEWLSSKGLRNKRAVTDSSTISLHIVPPAL